MTRNKTKKCIAACVMTLLLLCSCGKGKAEPEPDILDTAVESLETEVERTTDEPEIISFEDVEDEEECQDDNTRTESSAPSSYPADSSSTAVKSSETDSVENPESSGNTDSVTEPVTENYETEKL